MADEDITLNEDQLLESLEETNGEQETEIVTETEVSVSAKNQFHFALNAKAQFAIRGKSSVEACATKRRPFSMLRLHSHSPSRVSTVKRFAFFGILYLR